MNVMPVEIEGSSARIGNRTITLPGAPKEKRFGRSELGIRPEFVRIGREGMPATVTKVEDLGRRKVVRAKLDGQDIVAVIGEDQTVPAEPHIAFDPAGINIYADSWRVEMGA